MTEVAWSMFHFPSEKPIHSASSSVPSWSALAPNATDTARSICEGYFNDAEWARHIGTEDTHDTVKLVIHSPAEIAGTFRVALERYTKATAERMIPLFAETAEPA